MTPEERVFADIHSNGERMRMLSDKRWILAEILGVVDFANSHAVTADDWDMIATFIARRDKSISRALLEQAWNATR